MYLTLKCPILAALRKFCKVSEKHFGFSNPVCSTTASQASYRLRRFLHAPHLKSPLHSFRCSAFSPKMLRIFGAPVFAIKSLAKSPRQLSFLLCIGDALVSFAAAFLCPDICRLSLTPEQRCDCFSARRPSRFGMAREVEWLKAALLFPPYP